MNKAIVHIGTGKTGSTAIQFFLFNYPFRNIVYPKLGRDNQNVLSVIYQSQKDWNPVFLRLHGHLNQAELAKIRTDYLKSFRKSLKSGHPIIISAEIIHKFDDKSISVFKNELLRGGYDDILIVIYVREMPAHYMSRMQQGLRHRTRIIHPDSYKMPIKDYVLRWERFFPGRIDVRSFNRSQFINGDVVTDFVNLTNRFFGSDITPPSSAIIKNQSFSVEQMMVLQEFRRVTGVEDQYQYDFIYEKLIHYVRTIAGAKDIKMTKPVLREDISAKIFDSHRSDIEYLENMYGLTFPEKPDYRSSTAPVKINVNDISTIVETYNPESFIKLRNYIMADLLRRNLKDSRYLNWIRSPYWRIRDSIKARFQSREG